MYLPNVELHQAVSLSEASHLLARFGPSARLLAGGTDLLVDLKAQRIRAGHLISIKRIPTLNGITLHDQALHIGALTTITELDESPLVRERASEILDATRCMAVRQVRNLATVGGNLASAVPCADLPPILTAMNASVALWQPNQERLVPLERFFVGARQTTMDDSEILTHIIIPKNSPGFGVAYERFGLRAGNAIAVASSAAALQLLPDGTIDQATIVLGAVAPIPKMATEASGFLTGLMPNDTNFAKAAHQASKAAAPISDVRGSASFRCELVEVLTRRALATALRRARRES